MKQYVRFFAVAALAIGVATPVSAEPARLRIGSAYSLGLIQIGTQAKHLEEILNSASGGEVQAKLYEPGALVPALEVFDAVKNGSLEAAWAAPGFWASKEPALPLFSSVPFGPQAEEYIGWLFHGGGEELMQKIYAKHNIHSMICGMISPEASGWFREEITSLDQLKGLKMRFFGLGAIVMQKLGVDTQLLAGGDVYPALERGTIDAAEFSSPALDYNVGLYQVAKHYYFPGWHQQATTLDLMINKEKWDAMSDAQRSFISDACRANVAFGISEGPAIQGKALKELEAKGVQFHTWPKDMLDKFHVTWDEVAAEQAAANPEFKEAWGSLQAFRDEAKKWNELGYLR
jgi:TRAP-type mannitol/chloroaromatic compound transport system substrate-binding protein